MATDPRVGELLALEATGVTLPYPAEEIVRLEDDGYIVDIDTGDVLSHVTAQPTVFGEAIAHLLAQEVTEGAELAECVARWLESWEQRT